MHSGNEHIAQDEESDIKKIIEVFKKTLPKYYPTGTVKRMFHPKTHGLLKASFIVREDLESEYRTGLFQPGVEYPMWCRLSNAKKKPSPDANKDMRGMALKLFEVKGEKLLEHDRNAVTQDFLLITSKTLQTRSVKDFQKSLTALMSGGIKLLLYVITHPAVAVRSIKQISKCSNLLEESFYSTTPFRFGSGNRVVKYAVLPQQKIESVFPKNPTENFLQTRLADDLAVSDFYFDFMVQFQEDHSTMPIEDPTVEWKSPFIKLATIKIPKQNFLSQMQNEYVESLSFTPWHCIKDHEPIGGVNRARKAVYVALSEFRHKLNGLQETEPASLASFE